MSAPTTPPPTTTPPVPEAGGAPPDPQRPSRAVAVVVTVIGVLLLAGTLGQGLVVGLFSSGATSSSRALDVDGVTDLELRTSAADLRVSFDDVDRATLDVDGRGPDAQWRFERDGDRLVVAPERRSGWLPGWWRDDVEVTLVLPRALEGRLAADLDVAAGRLIFTGDVDSLDLDVSAGRSVVEGAARTVDIQVSSGGTTVTTSGTETASLDVAAGAASLSVGGDEAPTTTDVAVSAGRALVQLPDADYAVTGDAAAGARTIDVRTDPASPHELDVRVSAGTAEVTYAD